eukprot:TRINITY_DN271_c0_g1_i10.p1 TRINITY_DN271_c0_g1~~TRINITY_DN271_c0_g1_i10.p1  ORF type:complete len:6036 (+),score=1765.20 TRINITY_DN271_c0_g1_i10:697-18804(+)
MTSRRFLFCKRHHCIKQNNNTAIMRLIVLLSIASLVTLTLCADYGIDVAGAVTSSTMTTQVNPAYDTFTIFTWIRASSYQKDKLFWSAIGGGHEFGIKTDTGKFKFKWKYKDGVESKCEANTADSTPFPLNTWTFVTAGRETVSTCFLNVEASSVTTIKATATSTEYARLTIIPALHPELDSPVDGDIFFYGMAKYYAPHNWFKRMTQMRWGGWTHTGQTYDWAFITTGNSSPLTADYGNIPVFTITGATFSTSNTPHSLGALPSSLQPYYASVSAGNFAYTQTSSGYTSSDTSWTMEAIIKVTAQGTSDRFIWAHRNAHVQAAFGQKIKPTLSGGEFQPFFRYGDASGSCFRGDIFLTSGRWYHWAGTYDGTTAKFYINGEQMTDTTTGCDQAGTSNTYIGLAAHDSFGGTTNKRFAGGIAEVRMWKVVRTQAQIRAGMMAVSDLTHPSLVKVFQFNGYAKESLSGTTSFLQFSGSQPTSTQDGESPRLTGSWAAASVATTISPTKIACDTPNLTFGGVSTGDLYFAAFATTGNCGGTSKVGRTALTSGTVALGSAISTVGTYKICYSIDGGLTYKEQTTPTLTVAEDMSTSDITGTAAQQVTTTWDITIQGQKDNVNHAITCAHMFSCTYSFDTGNPVTATLVSGSIYRCRRAVTTKGTFTVDVKIDGGHITGSPYTLTASPGPTNIAQSTVADVFDDALAAGSARNFDITAKDEFQNVRDTNTDTVELRVHRNADGGATGNDIVTTPATKSAGVYQGAYAASAITIAGDYTVTVKFGASTVRSGTMTVNPLGISATKCVATGDTGTKTAGQQLTITVFAKDTYENALTGLSAGTFTATFDTNNVAHADFVVVSTKDGDNYRIQTSIVTVADTYTLSIKENGNHIKDSPFTFTATYAGTTHTKSNVTGGTTFVAGTEVSATIQALDAYDNIKAGHGEAGDFSGTITGPAGMAMAISNLGGNGQYKAATSSATIAGSYSAAYKHNGNTLAIGSPIAFTITPAATSESDCIVYGGQLNVNTAGRLGRVYIQSVDQYKNNRTVHDDTFTVTLVHKVYPGVTLNALVTNDATAARYVATYNATLAGNYEMQIKRGATNVASSPYTTTIIPAHSKPENAYFSPGYIPSTGIAGTTHPSFTVQPRDAYGNNVTRGVQDCRYLRDDGSTSTYIQVYPFNQWPTNKVAVSMWTWSRQNQNEATWFSYANSASSNGFTLQDVSALRLCISGSCSVLDNVPNMADGVWRHVLVQYETTSKVAQLYVGGSFIGIATFSATSIQAGGRLIVGVEQDAYPGLAFGSSDVMRGFIDNLAIWDKYFTASEVLDVVYGIPDVSRTDLMALWTFDDCGQGSKYRDSTAYGNDFSIIGSAGTVDLGMAVFTQATTPLKRANFQSPTTAFTISFWANPNADSPTSGTVVSYEKTGESGNQIWLYKTSDVNIWIGGTTGQTGNTGVDMGTTWAHLSITWNSANGAVKIYKNGVQSYTGTESQGHTIPTGGTWAIGCDQDGESNFNDANQCLKGRLQDFAVFDYVQTVTQIQHHMNYGYTNEETGLLGHWFASQSDGNVQYDESPLEQHLGWVGTPNYKAGRPSSKFAQYADRYSITASPSMTTNPTTSVVGHPSIQNKISTYRATIAQTYTLTLKDKQYDQNAITSPYTLPITPAAVNAAESVASGAGVSTGTAGILSTLTIQAKDEFKNDLTQSGDTITGQLLKNPFPVVPITVTPSGGNDGQYSVSYNATGKGGYQFTLQINGQNIKNFPKTVLIAPGVSVAPLCTASGSGLTSATAGVSTFFDVTLRDAFGNQRDTTGDAITSQLVHNVYGGISVSATASDQGAGVRRMTYTVTVSGVYTISTIVNTRHISASPHTMTCVPNSAVATNSMVYDSGAFVAEAGQLATVSFQTRDTHDNNRTLSNDAIVASLQNTPVVPVNVVPNGGGLFTLTYNATVAKTYTLSVTVNAVSYGNSKTPQVYTTATHPPNSLVTGTGKSNAVAGDLTTVVVQARDAFDNLRTVETDTFVGQLTHNTVNYGPIAATVTAQAAGSGRYNVAYNVTLRGTYTFTIKSNGLHVSGSPFNVNVVPTTPAVEYSTAFGPALAGSPATAGIISRFTIQSRDRYSNNRTTNDPFTVEVPHTTYSLNANSISVTNGPNDSGQDEVSYTATVAGTYSVRVTNTGKTVHVVGSPYTVQVNPAATTAAQSFAYGAQLIRATAGAPNAFKIQARDQYLNNQTLTGQTFVTTISHQVVSYTPTPMLTNPGPGGLYQLAYNSTIAGAYQVDIKYQGAHVMNSPYSLVIDPTITHGTNSLAYGNGISTTTAGKATTFTVQARDAFSNNRSVTTDTVTVVYTHKTLAVASPAVTITGNGVSGTYSVATNITVSGQWNLDVKVNGQHVFGSPFTTTVNPDISHGATSIMDYNGANHNTAGALTQWIVQIRDRFSNNQTHVSDTVAATAQHTTVGTYSLTATVTPLSTGRYVLGYTPTISGTYSVTMQVNGQPLGVSPHSTLVVAAATSTGHCTAAGAAVNSVIAGEIASFVIQARDQYSNNKTVFGDQFTVRAVHQTGYNVNATVSNHGSFPGAYVAVFNATVSGTYSLMVFESNTYSNIKNAPFTMNAIPNTLSAVATTIEVIPFGVSVPATVTVTARDKFSNIRSQFTDGFTVGIFVNGIATSVTPQAGNAGNYGFVYQTQEPSTINVTATVTATGELVTGVKWHTTTSFGPANYTAFDPWFGPSSGGTLVTVIGTQFVKSTSMIVKIGGTPCATTQFISETKVICTTPNHGSVANLGLTVTNNGGVNDSVAHLQFSYKAPETVTSFTPTNGPVYGRTIVTVTGTNFFENSLLNCKFGPTVSITKPTFVSSTLIYCVSPENLEGDKAVLVANNGQQYVAADAGAGLFRYIEPFSPLCRISTELSIGVLERQAKNQLYFPNLAKGANTTGTSQGADIDIEPDIVNDDRCCQKTDQNLGIYCGVNFQRQFISNMTDLAQAVVRLPRQAFVNEFITSWFRPCRNQPSYYLLDYSVTDNDQWVNLFTRVTKSEAVALGTQKPCSFVPSDKEDASICIDFLTSELRAQAFRIRFNNTAENMGLFGTTTDGAWLYEFEVHGKYTDIPEFWELSQDLSSWPAQASVAQITVPTITARTLNHQREILYANDTTSTNAHVKLLRGVGLTDVTSSYLSGTTTVAVSNGFVSFTDLKLNSAPADTYRIVVYGGNNMTEAYTNLTVIIGPAHEMRRTTGSSFMAQTALTVDIPTTTMTLYDISNSAVGATDTTHRWVNVSIATGPSGNTASPVLTGTVNGNMTDGAITFSDLKLNKPVPGVYNITFTIGALNGGTTQQSIQMTVTQGVPYALRLVTGITGTYPSATTVTANTVTVEMLDISQTRTTLTLGNAIKVNVASANQSEAIQGAGATGCTMTNGVCSVANMQFGSPTAGDYLIDFTSYGVLNTSSVFRVIIGTPVELRFRQQTTPSHPSVAIVNLTAIVLDAYDVGGSFVTTTDATVRPTTVTNLNATSLTLGGTTTVNMINGTVTFGDLYLIAPAVGTYRLRFSTGSLSTVELGITITVGPAAKLFAHSPTSEVSVETSAATVLPSLTVRALDSGGFFVGTSDTKNHTISVSISPSGANLNSQGATAVMFNGTLTMSNVTLNSPSVKNYTLQFTSADGLTPVSILLIVNKGFPIRVQTSSSFLGSLASQNLVTLPAVTIKLLDAGGSQVIDARAANKVVRVMTTNSTDLVLQGTTSYVLTGSSVVFNNISFYRPKARSYELIFGTDDGLLNDTTSVVIVVGQPYSLNLLSAGSSSSPTETTVSVPSQSLEVLDIGSNRVSTASNIVVNATNSVQGVPLIGTTTTTSSNGLIGFNGLTLSKPPNATYTITFAATGLVSAQFQLLVTAGPPFALSSDKTFIGPLASVASLSIPSLFVNVLDTADNQVPVKYADVRNVTIRQTSGPKANALQGTLVQTYSNVSAGSFSSMTLAAPPAGNYSLIIESAGILSRTIIVGVKIGPAVTTSRVSPTQGLSLPTSQLVNLPDITIRAYDAGSVFVGSTDASDRTFAVWSTNGASLAGNLTATMKNGEVTFSGLGLNSPGRKTFELQFSSAGLTNSTLQVNITAGFAYKLSASNVTNSQVASVATSAFGLISMYTQDTGSGTTFKGVVGRQVSVSINDTSATLVGTTQVNVSDTTGLIQFADLGLGSPKVGAYLLTFTSDGLLSTSAVVTVVTGPAHHLYYDVNSPPVTARTTPNTLIPKITLKLQDIGDNFVTVDSDRTVIARVGNQSLPEGEPIPNNFVGSNSQTMVNGNVTFDGLILASPKAGTYVLEFLSGTLGTVQVDMFISVGPASSLKISSITTAALPSEVTLAVPEFTVQAIDSAGVPVLNTDSPSTRSISVWFGNNRFQGQTSFTMTNGVVTIGNVTLNRPPQGEYVLTVGTSGLSNVTANFTVSLGAAIELRTEGEKSQVVQSRTSQVLGNITIAAYESGGAAVNAADNQNRVVHVYSPTLTITDGATATMWNGRVTLMNVRVSNAKQGDHMLYISTAGLLNTTAIVNVTQGPVVKLVSNAFPSTAIASQFSTQLPTMSAQLLDAGGDQTTLANGEQVTVGVVPSNAVTLVGATTVNVTGSTIVFSGLNMTAPDYTKSPFTLKMTPIGGIASASGSTVQVNIKVGLPVSLKQPSKDTTFYSSANTVTIKPVTVVLQDAANQAVGVSDMSNQRAVTITKLNASLIASVPTGLTTGNGSVTISSLQMSKPRVGQYMFQLGVAELGDVIVSFQVVTGLPFTLAAKEGSSAITPTGLLVSVPPRTIVVQDVGSNDLGQADPANRRVIFSFASSAGTYDAVRQTVVALAYTGTFERFSSNGEVVFAGLSMERPRFGEHVAEYRTNGLQSAFVRINVTTGFPEQLVVDGNLTISSTYTGSNDKLTLIPAVSMKMVDAARGVVSTAAPVTITAFAEVRDINGLNRNENYQFNSDAEDAVTLPMIRSGTVTRNTVQGVAVFDDLRIPAIQGDYLLRLSSTGFNALQMVLTVVPGPPASFIVLNNGSKIYNNVGVMPIPPKFRLLDLAGNRANTTGVALLLATSPPVRSILGQSQASDANGIVEFTALSFVGQYGVSITYTISSFPDIGTMVMPNVVTIVTCNDVRQFSQPNANGYGCLCNPGYFSSTDSSPCLPCDKARYQPKAGQVECEACPANMDTSGLSAVATSDGCSCIDGYYERTESGERVCKSCTSGASCVQGQIIQAKPGFFGVKTGTDQYLACPEPTACLGGPNSTCATGYEGPLCGVCSTGYGSFGTKCEACGENANNYTLAIIFFLVAISMMAFLVRTATGEKSQASIMLKIALNYMQVLAFIGEFRLNWGDETQGLFSTSGLALFSLNIHPVSCAFQWTYMNQLDGYLMFPLFTVVIPLFIYGITYLWATVISKKFGINVKRPELEIERTVFRVNNDADRERLLNKMQETLKQGKPKEEKQKMGYEQAWRYHMTNMYTLTVMVILFIAHPMVSKAVFQIFNCIELEDGSRYLEADMRINCASSVYEYYLYVWGYTMVFGYCLGVLAIGMGILFVNRKRLNQPTVMARYRFLYDGYAKKRYFWEIIIMARKLTIVAIIVRWKSAPLTQLYAGMWMAMGALVLHLYSKPFAENLATGLETLGLSATCVTLMTGLLFYSSETTKDDENIISIFLLVLNVIALSIFGIVIVREFIRIARSNKMVKEMEENLAKQLEERRLHNEAMTKRNALLTTFNEALEQSKEDKRRGVKRSDLIDRQSEMSSRRATIVMSLVANSSLQEQPQNIKHALTSLKLSLKENALRSKFFSYADNAVPVSSVLSGPEKDLWRAISEYVRMVHDDPRATEALEDKVNEIVEQYLDEDADEFVEVDFGILVEVMTKMNSHLLTDRLFDATIEALYGCVFPGFKESLSSITDGPTVEERVESIDTLLGDEKLRPRFGKFIAEKGKHADKVQAVASSVIDYINRFDSMDADEREETCDEIIHRFFDDDEDEYLAEDNEPLDFGIVTQIQVQVDKQHPKEKTAFNELMSLLFLDDYVLFKAQVLEMGSLSLL